MLITIRNFTQMIYEKKEKKNTFSFEGLQKHKPNKTITIINIFIFISILITYALLISRNLKMNVHQIRKRLVKKGSSS